MLTSIPNEPEEKKHFFMVAGEVVFKTQENEMGSVRLNAMVLTNEQKFPLRYINLAQQTLQMNFFKRHSDPVEILDVVLNGLMYLGAFTEKEFHTTPEGMRMVPMRTEGNA